MRAIKRAKGISLALGAFLCLFLAAGKSSPGQVPPSGMCLVGTFDLRNGYTLLQVINPTAIRVGIKVVFFDENEKPLKCLKADLSANDLFEINVKKSDPGALYGVVKIFSFPASTPFFGIVGFQRHYLQGMGATEANLTPVPTSAEDAKIVGMLCH